MKSKISIQSKILAAFLSAALLCPPQAAWATNGPRMDLGICVDGGLYFKNIFHYAQVANWKTLDPKTGNGIGTPTLDANDYPIPTTLSSYSVQLGLPPDYYIPDDYVMTWENDGLVSLPYPSSVSNVKVGDHRVTFTLNPADPLGGQLLVVHIDKDNPANPVTNIAIVQQRFENDYVDHPFHPDWLSYASKFKCIRTMGWAGVFPSPGKRITGTLVSWTATTVTLEPSNSQPDDYYAGWMFLMNSIGTPGIATRCLVEHSVGNVLTVGPAITDSAIPATPRYILDLYMPMTVAQRTLPTKINQVSQQGMAWEYLAKAAEDAHVNLWVNVPTTAKDEFIVAMAHYFHQNFSNGNPDLKLYIEYSNECFNFFGSGWEVSAVMAPYYGYANFDWWNSIRCAQIAYLFHTEYGEPLLHKDRKTSRLVCLIGAFFADAGGARTRSMLDFNQWPKSEPYGLAGTGPTKIHTYEYLDAVHEAAYFSPLLPTGNQISLSDLESNSLSQTLDTFQRGVNQTFGWLKTELDTASQRNLDCVVYEGGDGVDFSKYTEPQWYPARGFLRAVYFSPRFLDIYLQYLNQLNNLNDWNAGKRFSLFVQSGEFQFDYDPAGPGGPGNKCPSRYGSWGFYRSSIDPEVDNDKAQALMQYLNGRTIPVEPDRLWADAINASQINLHWADNSSNETSYSLERKDGKGAFNVLAGNLAANTSSYVDTANIGPSSTSTSLITPP